MNEQIVQTSTSSSKPQAHAPSAVNWDGEIVNLSKPWYDKAIVGDVKVKHAMGGSLVVVLIIVAVVICFAYSAFKSRKRLAVGIRRVSLVIRTSIKREQPHAPLPSQSHDFTDLRVARQPKSDYVKSAPLELTEQTEFEGYKDKEPSLPSLDKIKQLLEQFENQMLDVEDEEYDQELDNYPRERALSRHPTLHSKHDKFK